MHIARRYSPPPPDPYPLPSLRLVILCVSVAVALSMVVVILLIDVRPPPLSDIFLTPAYFPLGQSLQMKTRRWTKNEKSCASYGIPRMNETWTDTLCGQAIWQSSAELEEGDRYVNKIETIYRFFVNDNASAQYFTEYLLNGASLSLSLDSYSDETSTAPKAGQEFQAFRWEPPLVSQATAHSNSSNANDSKIDLSTKKCSGKGCSNIFRHIVYVFRFVNLPYTLIEIDIS